jgi:tetratricopeptide (TPR) repeat protein
MLRNSRPARRVRALIFWVLLTGWLFLPLYAQQGPTPEALPTLGTSGSIAGLQLEPSRSAELKGALDRRDYKRAETILVEEAQRDPKSARAAKLYTLVGHILFLDGQYLNSAIAWKKAEAIAPLDDQTRFSLAMAYLRLSRPDWGRDELQRLSQGDPQNPLYLYWLARLDYDARAYIPAISRLRRVIELDPNMMRAYNNLGLCYDALGQFDEAIRSFNRAIELNRRQEHPSAWPPLNLGVSLITLNRLDEAVARLHEALSYNPEFPQADYELGLVLEKEGKFEEAIAPLQRAAQLDPSYAEPHYTLGKIYQRQGKREEAQEQIEKFKKLKKELSPPQSPALNQMMPSGVVPLPSRQATTVMPH